MARALLDVGERVVAGELEDAIDALAQVLDLDAQRVGQALGVLGLLEELADLARVGVVDLDDRRRCGPAA